MFLGCLDENVAASHSLYQMNVGEKALLKTQIKKVLNSFLKKKLKSPRKSKLGGAMWSILVT